MLLSLEFSGAFVERTGFLINLYPTLREIVSGIGQLEHCEHWCNAAVNDFVLPASLTSFAAAELGRGGRPHSPGQPRSGFYRPGNPLLACEHPQSY